MSISSLCKINFRFLAHLTVFGKKVLLQGQKTPVVFDDTLIDELVYLILGFNKVEPVLEELEDRVLSHSLALVKTFNHSDDPVEDLLVGPIGPVDR